MSGKPERRPEPGAGGRRSRQPGGRLAEFFRDEIELPFFRRFLKGVTDVWLTFRAGHRIMIQVQSRWFRLMDRNPQTSCDVYRARPEDFRKAVQRVCRPAEHSSALRLRVMPAAP